MINAVVLAGDLHKVNYIVSFSHFLLTREPYLEKKRIGTSSKENMSITYGNMQELKIIRLDVYCEPKTNYGNMSNFQALLI